MSAQSSLIAVSGSIVFRLKKLRVKNAGERGALVILKALTLAHCGTRTMARLIGGRSPIA